MEQNPYTKYLNAHKENKSHHENAVITLKPFFHSNLNSTLENILFEKEPEKNTGVLEKVLSDKCRTLKASVVALLDEIKIRETLDTHLLNNMDDDIAGQNTHLLQIDNQNYTYSPQFSEEKENIKKQFEDNVLELRKEKRTEYLECWRDLMFLKKYLMTAFKEYWELVKRKEVLSCDVGEMVRK